MLPMPILILEDEHIIAAELKQRRTRLGYTVVAMAGSAIRFGKFADRICLRNV
jgi:hypothetical protein